MYIFMPIQRRKKKKPKAKEKTPAVSQKVTQIVRVNVGDVKPKPRRRRAPAKKPAQPFAFGGGGGGGGGGLAQVVQAPQATQDVLQQSKELREIVNRLQTSPAQLTLLGAEQGGQAEQQILPDDQPVTRGQFRQIMGNVIGYQGGQMALAGERIQALNQAVHAFAPPQAAESESDITITELHDPAHTPSSTLVEPSVSTPMRMGRGKARTAEQNQSDLDAWAASGLTQKDFALQQGISYNTLSKLAAPHGGISSYRTSKGISIKKKKKQQGKASEESDSGDETDFP
jgi:hypothetical protein